LYKFINDLRGLELPVKGRTFRVMDGFSSLKRVFKEEFKKVKVSRLWRDRLHIARNVPAKVPRKHKNKIGNAIRSIFYALTRKKALELFLKFGLK